MEKDEVDRPSRSSHHPAASNQSAAVCFGDKDPLKSQIGLAVFAQNVQLSERIQTRRDGTTDGDMRGWKLSPAL